MKSALKHFLYQVKMLPLLCLALWIFPLWRICSASWKKWLFLCLFNSPFLCKINGLVPVWFRGSSPCVPGLPCMLSCANSRTKLLLLRRHSASPLEIKRASPLVASPTGIKWFWLVFWRVRSDFKHFKGWIAQRKLLSRTCSVSAPGELRCIRLLPWGEK